MAKGFERSCKPPGNYNHAGLPANGAHQERNGTRAVSTKTAGMSKAMELLESPGAACRAVDAGEHTKHIRHEHPQWALLAKWEKLDKPSGG